MFDNYFFLRNPLLFTTVFFKTLSSFLIGIAGVCIVRLLTFLLIHFLLGPGTAKKTLALLRAKLRKSVPFKRMKLMVVGLEVNFI